MNKKNNGSTINIMDLIRNMSNTAGFKTFLSILLAIVSGIFVGFLILLITSPYDSFDGLGYILAGSFRTPNSTFMKGIGDLLATATPLILVGLSVGFAFKTGLFNIGASGQYMFARFVVLYVGLSWSSLGFLHWPVAVLMGILAGALWGLIPGLFKALFNVNEVITSIMFNYIALFFTEMFILGYRTADNRPYFIEMGNETKQLPSSIFTPRLGLDKLFPNTAIDIGIIITIIIAITLFVILNKTKFGYELKACGYNKHASKYAGINDKRNIVLAMVIAGALAGLAGTFTMLNAGIYNSGYTIKATGALDTVGFTGIPIALLGLSHPIGIVFSALFITHLELAGENIQMLPYNPDIIQIIVGVIIYFSAFSLIISNFIAKKLKKKQQEEQEKKSSKPTVPPTVDEKGGN